MHASIVAQADELNALCRRHRVRRLELFGSAAGTQPTFGDVDCLVEFEPLPPDAYADAYFGLLEDLERLFRRAVDLVMVSAITSPYFLEGIAEDRAVLYAA